MALKTVRLELARHPDFPHGSAEHGYELRAPLAADGLLDPDEWRTVKERCTVHRFWGDAPAETGIVRLTRGNRWIFDYDRSSDGDDEPIFRLDRHRLTEGEYVSIREHDGQERTFRVASVR